MIKYKEISCKQFVDLLSKETVYLYNDYEDIVYKCTFDGKGVRYFAKIVGKKTGEYEVFTKNSNVLMDTLQQPFQITEEDYNNA